MKEKIVIASVLKSVDDVRSYEKIAQSIAKTNKYEVNIIGNVGKKESDKKNIFFHSHSLLGNSWGKRLLIRKNIFFQILRIKPRLLIISTHELLKVALLIKLISGCKVIYDVQENYVANINYLSNSWVKKYYSSLIQLKEALSRRYVDQYWLAEKCYSNELKFTQGRSIILENKALPCKTSFKKNTPIQLLFSGTISEYGGVRNAINIHEKFQEKTPDTQLKIIGQIHDDKLKKYLEDKVKLNEHIALEISSFPIPHPEILEAISHSTLGIIGYEKNQINKDKIPTKLYEYSRAMLPYLVAENTKWFDVGVPLGGAIPIDFLKPDIEKILAILQNHENLFPNTYPEEATWEYESKKLINSINTLLNNNYTL